MALMLALAAGRSRIVFPHDGYYDTRAMADRLRPHGAVAVAVDQLDLDVVEVALHGGPAVLWAETPTNPLLRVADLAALGCARRGGRGAVRGGQHGGDRAAAEAARVRGGGLGVLADQVDLGALGRARRRGRDAGRGAGRSVRGWRTAGGAIPGPFESWLVLRGMKTLPLRIARQSENALAIAEFLAAHPRVTAVHYPGWRRRRWRACRCRRLRAAALVRARRDGGRRPTRSSPPLSWSCPATSFGGVESTWERRARWAAETAPETLIRLSAGIEPAADLIADIGAARSLRRGGDAPVNGGRGEVRQWERARELSS